MTPSTRNNNNRLIIIIIIIMAISCATQRLMNFMRAVVSRNEFLARHCDDIAGGPLLFSYVDIIDDSTVKCI